MGRPSLLLLLILVCTADQSARAEQYVAFSLGAAQRLIAQTPAGRDYREAHPEVFSLGGITRVRGLVHDRQNRDVILVGQRDPGGTELTLDDLAVALRARLVRGEWPEVSIDPRADSQVSKRQDVRFQGGIEDTGFGYSLFEADYLLKRIGMGLVPAGVAGLRSEVDLMRQLATGSRSQVTSRYWFYPTSLQTVIREDVAAVKGLRVAVFTEVLSASINGVPVKDPRSYRYQCAEQFASQVSQRYSEMARTHPSFGRVQGMEELVALAYAAEQMEPRPDLAYWLVDYSVQRRETPRQVDLLERKVVDRRSVPGGSQELRVQLAGGVGLRAIALRAKAGDVTALRQAVLQTRPAGDALRWTFAVEDWGIAGVVSGAAAEDLLALASQGEFLLHQGRYDEAVDAFGKVLAELPQCGEAYIGRAAAYLGKDDVQSCLRDFDRLIELGIDLEVARLGRGLALLCDRDYDGARAELTAAIDLSPLDVTGYVYRAHAYAAEEAYAEARADLDRALELDPRCAEAYGARGTIHGLAGNYGLALRDFTRAIELSPCADFYLRRARAYEKTGALALAEEDLQMAAAFSSGEEGIGSADRLLASLWHEHAEYLPQRQPLRPPTPR